MSLFPRALQGKVRVVAGVAVSGKRAEVMRLGHSAPMTKVFLAAWVEERLPNDATRRNSRSRPGHDAVRLSACPGQTDEEALSTLPCDTAVIVVDGST